MDNWNFDALEKKMKTVVVVLSILVLTSCTSLSTTSSAINAYLEISQSIELGQSKAEVVEKLQLAQQNLSVKQRKAKEQYYHEDVLREIYFARSASYPDGILTDDEFTPYVFEDGKLVAIGWTALGGAKTQAQVRDNDSVHIGVGGYRHWY